MIKQKCITYQHNSQLFECVLITPDSLCEKKPALLMAPNWLGITDDAIELAKQQVQKGYIVLIVDLYGKAIRPQTNQQAAEAIAPLKADRQEMRKRMQLALNALVEQPNVDLAKIAAFGFCFGGGCSLELARSGASIKAAISFHGNLDTPHKEDAKQIKASILVMNGANDPTIAASQIADFFDEMKSVPHIDWQFINYGGAVHGFTDVNANEPNIKQYNEIVSKRAFRAMNDLLEELFIS